MPTKYGLVIGSGLFCVSCNRKNQYPYNQVFRCAFFIKAALCVMKKNKSYNLEESSMLEVIHQITNNITLATLYVSFILIALLAAICLSDR